MGPPWGALGAKLSAPCPTWSQGTHWGVHVPCPVLATSAGTGNIQPQPCCCWGRTTFPVADPGVRKDDLGTKRCLHIPEPPVHRIPSSSTRIRLSQALLPIWGLISSKLPSGPLGDPHHPHMLQQLLVHPGDELLNVKLWHRGSISAPACVAPHAGCSSLLAGKELNFESSSSGIVHTSLACN